MGIAYWLGELESMFTQCKYHQKQQNYHLSGS